MAPHLPGSCAQARVCDVATALLTVLQRMHALGVIHRDVKLENIFIGELQQPWRNIAMPGTSKNCKFGSRLPENGYVRASQGLCGHELPAGLARYAL